MLALLLTVLPFDAPLAGAVIVLDPGHGGQRYSRSYTGGTRGVNSKLTESELNLRVSLALAPKLTTAGATVHLTRTYDRRLSREGSSRADELAARVDYFEQFNPHFFLSVHHNAGPPAATGHTALYKHNAAEDALYRECATAFNDALAGAVPGPKRVLIKGDYHILRETAVPGTITEAGFQTSPAFDAASGQPDYPEREAAALLRGAVAYWAAHKPALVAARATRPRPARRATATDLDPAFQKEMGELLATVAPGGGYAAIKAGQYVERFRGTLADPAGFAVTVAVDGETIRLGGSVAVKAHHDRLIDLFVAMTLVALDNAIKRPV